jgi:hypothetical protein
VRFAFIITSATIGCNTKTPFFGEIWHILAAFGVPGLFLAHHQVKGGVTLSSECHAARA